MQVLVIGGSDAGISAALQIAAQTWQQAIADPMPAAQASAR
jgi:heterodisulfide reductase subunit A-like polyferredoxin